MAAANKVASLPPSALRRLIEDAISEPWTKPAPLYGLDGWYFVNGKPGAGGYVSPFAKTEEGKTAWRISDNVVAFPDYRERDSSGTFFVDADGIVVGAVASVHPSAPTERLTGVAVEQPKKRLVGGWSLPKMETTIPGPLYACPRKMEPVRGAVAASESAANGFLDSMRSFVLNKAPASFLEYIERR